MDIKSLQIILINIFMMIGVYFLLKESKLSPLINTVITNTLIIGTFAMSYYIQIN